MNEFGIVPDSFLLVSYAKLLYCAGVDPKTMQRLLRHADFSTTMNIYAEFDNTVTENNIELINSYMEKTF